MVNQADYSLYKCPYEHVEKECGHELKDQRVIKTLIVFGVLVALEAQYLH